MSFAEAALPKVIFTIELELALHQQTTQNAALLEDYTDLLLKLSAAYEMPFTWAVSDPAFSAAKEAILQSPLAQEIALLGDATWVGATAGRARFARELSRRVTAAQSHDIAIRSLVLRDAEPDDNLDLLRQHGIESLRLSPHASRDAVTASRFTHSLGITILPVTWSIGTQRSWWKAWSYGSIGDQFLRDARTNYRVISLRGDQLIDDDRALRDITALLELTAVRRDRNEVEFCTLSQCAKPQMTTIAA
jgi:hypothetical protein